MQKNAENCILLICFGSEKKITTVACSVHPNEPAAVDSLVRLGEMRAGTVLGGIVVQATFKNRGVPP
jgi:hypothetical protein